MLPLQLVLRPERAERCWPSPPQIHAKKRRDSPPSLVRRPSARRLSRTAPLLICSAQFAGASPPTPKLSSRRRSRGVAVHRNSWGTATSVSSRVLGLPFACIRLCSLFVEAAVPLARSIVDAAALVLSRWWGSSQEDCTVTLELVERPPESRQDLQDVVAENDRLKHTLNFALASHLMMTETTSALDQNAAFWMKRVEEAVALRLQQAEQQRDALTLQFAGLQERLDDKDQEIERLSHGFVWATESLNAKEDEICELQERLERYEALLEAQEPI